jgi:hypothetical protein
VHSFSVSCSFFLPINAQIQKPQVKITYPDMQQNIPSGRLKMYGISSDNHATLCQVHALLNDQKPYQNTTATGPEGKDDYSKWTYTFDPYYSLVRNGTNQLVSKIVCHYNDGTNSTAYNKLNVTGMGLATADLINQTQQSTGIVPTSTNTASEALLPPSAEQLVVSPAQEKPIEKSNKNSASSTSNHAAKPELSVGPFFFSHP